MYMHRTQIVIITGKRRQITILLLMVCSYFNAINDYSRISFVGTPCDINGVDLPPGSPPPARISPENDDFSPYDTRSEFEIADFLFRRNQMPGIEIDDLMDLWATTVTSGDKVPFANHEDLYNTIDATTLGDTTWESFSVKYTGEKPDIPDEDLPPWMLADYDVWFRNPQTIFDNQFANPDFIDEIDYSTKEVFGQCGRREFEDVMSGNWAWDQSVLYL